MKARIFRVCRYWYINYYDGNMIIASDHTDSLASAVATAKRWYCKSIEIELD